MPPITMMIKPVSGACNLRCRYCFYADVTSHREIPSYGRMSRDTLEALVRRALAYAEGTASFAFQGGEPTLAGVGFYRELLALQRRYNTRGVTIQNSIQTNAFQLDDELIDLFAQEHFLVGVSLDGLPETHDALRRDAQGRGTSQAVLKNIARLQAKGVEFNILCVVNRLVAEHPREVFEALRPYGYIQYIPCLDGLDGQKTDYSLDAPRYGEFLKQTFDLYYQAFLQNRFVSIRNFDNYVDMLAGRPPESCAMRGTCGQYYLIESDGGVYPCDFYVLDEWKMGNIRQDSFFRLAKSEVGARFRAASVPTPPGCAECRWHALCRGGCRRDREPFCEGRPSANAWCEAYRAFFDYSYERLRDVARRALQACT